MESHKTCTVTPTIGTYGAPTFLRKLSVYYIGTYFAAAANKSALAVAVAAGLQFIRAEGFVFSHVADEGILILFSNNYTGRY